MMSCREFVARSSDLVDGSAPFSERVRLRLHWMMCAVCRAFLRQMKETAHATHAAAHATHAAPGDTLPSALEDKLLAALDDDGR